MRHERMFAGHRLDLARFGYQELLVAGRGFPDRLWAVTG